MQQKKGKKEKREYHFFGAYETEMYFVSMERTEIFYCTFSLSFSFCLLYLSASSSDLSIQAFILYVVLIFSFSRSVESVLTFLIDFVRQFFLIRFLASV